MSEKEPEPIIRILDIDDCYHGEYNFKTNVTHGVMVGGKSMTTLELMVPVFDINDREMVTAKLLKHDDDTSSTNTIELTEPSVPGITWRYAKERNEDEKATLLARSSTGDPNAYVPKCQQTYQQQAKLENTYYANPTLQSKTRVFKFKSSSNHKLVLLPVYLSNEYFNPLAKANNCDVTLDPVKNINRHQWFDYLQVQADGNKIITKKIQHTYTCTVSFKMVCEGTVAQIEVVEEPLDEE